MFFKRSKIDKKSAAETAAEATAAPVETVEAAETAAPVEAAPQAEAVEPSLSVGAHTNAAGATDPASLGFKTTADLQSAHGPVGQTKAMDALSFGAGIKGSGFHMLVIGREGTGRRTATRAKLQEAGAKAGRPADWVYVSSFDPTGGFRALKLPAGTAKPFRRKDGAGDRPTRRRIARCIRRRRLRPEAPQDRGGISLQPRGCAGSAAPRGRVTEHRAVADAGRYRRRAGA